MKIIKKTLIFSITLLVTVIGVFGFGGTQASANTNGSLNIYNGSNKVNSVAITNGDQYFSAIMEGYGVYLENASNGSAQFELTLNSSYRFELSPGYKLLITDYNGQQISEINETKTFTVENGDFANSVRLNASGSGFMLLHTIEEGKTYTFNIIKVNVTPPDSKSPVISGKTTFMSDVSNPSTVEYFFNKLTATDETDGDVTSSLKIIADTFTPNKNTVGLYTFTVEVADKAGNKTTAVLNVNSADIGNPVISGSATTVSIGYKETYNIENFRKTLTVTDNYYTIANSAITVSNDLYTPSKGTLGTYNVTFRVEDPSGNEGFFVKPVKVIDNIKPVFTGPTTIETSNTTVLTEADVRSQLTANDEIDGILTSKIKLVEDNYTGKGNIVGSYTIKYSVTDNAGNVGTHTVTVKRSDKIPPNIWVKDGYSIVTDANTPISRDIIIDLLYATGLANSATTTEFTFLVDEYTENETTPGIYAMSIQSRSVNGSENIYNMSVVVTEDANTPADTTVPGTNLFNDKTVYIAVGIVAIILVGAVFYKKKRK